MVLHYERLDKGYANIIVDDDCGTGPYRLYHIMKYDNEESAKIHVYLLKNICGLDDEIIHIFYDPTDVDGMPWLIYCWKRRAA